MTIPSLKIHPDEIKKWMSNETATSQVVKISMIVSTKALKQGDALYIFQPSNKQRTN